MGFAKGGTAVVIGGATIAGFFASACSLPFDYVKTQMQKMKPDPVTGELPFNVGGVVRPRGDKQVAPMHVLLSCQGERVSLGGPLNCQPPLKTIVSKFLLQRSAVADCEGGRVVRRTAEFALLAEFAIIFTIPPT